MGKPHGWHREPARHALASKGIRTTLANDYPKITLTGRVVPMHQYPKFIRAAKEAHDLGHEIGNKGVSDELAGDKAFDQIHASIRKVIGREWYALGPDTEWDTVHSYLWDDFWRGWREGFQDYREREWD